LLSIAEYYATYNSAAGSECAQTSCLVVLTKAQNKYRVPINIGIGMDFFLNQTIALKLDGRNYFYVDDKPDYAFQNGFWRKPAGLHCTPTGFRH
jgi:hypothetical protein